MNSDTLKLAGVNYDAGIKRFGGNTALYEKFLAKFPSDESYSALKTALENKNYKDAFAAAHTLKGVAGNLSIDGLYDAVSPLLEELRAGHSDNSEEYFSKIEATYNEVIEALK